MLRTLAATLLLLVLVSCTPPSATTPFLPTQTPEPPIKLATFTPVISSAAPAIPTLPTTPTPLSNFWQLLFPGADITQTDGGLVVLRHAPNLAAYHILFESNPEQAKQLSDWLDESPQAMAGVNCGFYWEKEGKYLHMGLLEVNGERLAPVRVKWGAALLVRDGRAELMRQPKKKLPPLMFGVQGWPTLVWQGEIVAELDEIDKGEMARRTAVGVDDTGRVLWIVDNQGSTLTGFAQRLLQEEIGLVSAVNLDGGASTGLRWREAPGDIQSGVDSLPIPCVITFSPLE
jgi:hypothetical protein